MHDSDDDEGEAGLAGPTEEQLGMIWTWGNVRSFETIHLMNLDA